jgi:hypothetical protein
MKRLGSKVTCQLFNTGDNKFYGDRWVATIEEIDPKHETSVGFVTPYKVKKDPKIFLPEGCNPYIWLSEKEVNRKR